MHPATPIRTDSLPQFATVIGPGAFASSPYVFLVLNRYHAMMLFFDRHEAIALAMMILAWINVGYAIESIGSYVEVYCIDRKKTKRDEMLVIWRRYLKLVWSEEPIGQRYLRKLLISFKFELNMFVATIAAIPGVVLLLNAGIIECDITLWLLIGLVFAALLLFKAAWDSSTVLAEVRENLVNAFPKSPLKQK